MIVARTMRFGGWLAWIVVTLVVACGGAQGAEGAGSAVVDVRTGALLLGERADEVQRGGASYHLLVVLSALEQAKLGMLPLDVPVSADAQTLNELGKRPSERLKLSAEKTYLLSDLLKAILLVSSDTAAAVAAEAMWGSRDNAIAALNERARRMGLVATQIAELASDAEGNVTTASELARLVALLWREHREVRDWGTLRGFPFDGGRLVLANAHLPPPDVGTWAFYDRFGAPQKKRVLYQRVGVLVSEREGMTLAAVRVGEEEAKVALESLVAALQQTLAEFQPVTVVRAGEPLNLRIAVEGGTEAFVVPQALEEVRIPLRRGEEGQVRILFQLPSVVAAPVSRGEPLGEVVVELDNRIVAVVPAVSPRSVGNRGLRAAGVKFNNN